MAGFLDGKLIFQSTPPARGATMAGFLIWWATMQFQSTPPARGATFRLYFGKIRKRISIHAPREGGDYSGGFES